MRIKNWIGAGTLASAACLLAACGGMDPSDPGAMSDELGAFQSMTPTQAADLSQGAACVESIRPTGLECPGLSQIEVAAIQASIQPRLMSITPQLRVTVLRTGGTLLARIDGGENSAAFESLFGTSSLLVPVQADGTFEITTPIAERGAGFERRLGGLGVPGMAPGFGMPGMAPGFGTPGMGPLGLAGRLGQQPLMGPIGGGPASAFTGGQPGIGGAECNVCGPSVSGPPPSSIGAPMSPLSAPFGIGASCACPGVGFGPQMVGPGFGAAMRPTQNAYGVLAHLGGKIDTANLQFAKDPATNTEIAILDRDAALQMQGEIVLVPLTPGLEEGGPQAAPGGQQAVPVPMAPRGARQAYPGAPQGPGALGAYGQQGAYGPYGAPQGAYGAAPQGAYGAPQGAYGAAPQGAYGAPQGAYGAPQAYAPGGPEAAPSGEAGVACRIPLQFCGSCGFDTGLTPQGAIVTTPAVPEVPACVPMVVRPVMQACPTACP